MLVPARQLERVETVSADELAALQADRLRWSLRHAYHNVEFYRRRFDEAGCEPGEVTLQNLSRLPFTTRDDLRDHYPWGLLAVPRERLSRIQMSSGISGRPTLSPYTKRDITMWGNLMVRCLRAAGVVPGDRVHVGYEYGLFTGGLGSDAGALMMGCVAIPVSAGMTRRHARLIMDLEPDVLMATPSYTLTIFDELKRTGVDPRTTNLRVGLLGAEPWTEDKRREIEEYAAIDAIDIYGLAEVLGPGVASECVETKDGLHLWEDHFYPEVIDPDSGEALPDGERGELVLTTLTRRAMPLIRYRTGDVTRLLPPTTRSVRRIDRIAGRVDEMVILRGMDIYPGQIEELILRIPELAPRFRLVLTRPDRLDELTVQVEPRSEHVDRFTRREYGDQLRRLIRQEVGVKVTVEVVDPYELESVTGKRRLVDLRD